jgi:hypothetical protein
MRHRMPIFLSQGIELPEGVRIAAKVRDWWVNANHYTVAFRASKD